MSGGIGIIFLLLSLFASAAELLFYATDSSQRLKKEFAVKKQILVHVVVKKVAGQIDVQVPDLVAYGGRRISVQVSTINGVSTTKYSYALSFDQEGVYSLGKARVVAGNNEFFSLPLELIVSDRIIEEDLTSGQASGGQIRNQKGSDPLSRLSVEATNPFVGQKVPCFLYVYYDEQAHLSPSFRFSLPLSDEYRLSALGKPEGGREFFNGKSYRYVRWPFELFPLKSGEISIEPFSIEYEYEEDHHSNFQSVWDQFAHFFDKRRRELRVAKQVIFVRAVPPFQDKAVQAVGQFKTFGASVTPLIITEKEVSTVILELTGDGNLDDVTHPPLVIDNQASLYESHSSVTQVNGAKKKTFEYIIQPYHAGNLEIPSQEIITFDPIIEKHVLLKSDPQTIIVKALPGHQLEQESRFCDNERKNEKAGANQELSDNISEFIDQFKIPGKDFFDFSELIYSEYLLYLLVTVLLVFMCNFFLMFSDYFLQIKKVFNRFVAYRRASNSLIQKRLKRDGAGIYILFVNLFMDRFKLSKSADFGYRFLERVKVDFADEAEQTKWVEFCRKIGALHFGVNTIDSIDGIFDEAEMWIDVLQKRGL